MTNQLEAAKEWLADLNKIIDITDNEHTKQKRDVLEWLVEEAEQNKRYREALIKVKLGSESDVIHYSTRLKSINKIAVEALEDES